MEVTFVFDEIIVSTTVDVDDYRGASGASPEDSDETLAVDAATELLSEYGLPADRAGEIQVDGEVYEG
jgi:hypothetical protein